MNAVEQEYKQCNEARTNLELIWGVQEGSVLGPSWR